MPTAGQHSVRDRRLFLTQLGQFRRMAGDELAASSSKRPRSTPVLHAGRFASGGWDLAAWRSKASFSAWKKNAPSCLAGGWTRWAKSLFVDLIGEVADGVVGRQVMRTAIATRRCALAIAAVSSCEVMFLPLTRMLRRRELAPRA